MFLLCFAAALWQKAVLNFQPSVQWESKPNPAGKPKEGTHFFLGYLYITVWRKKAEFNLLLMTQACYWMVDFFVLFNQAGFSNPEDSRPSSHALLIVGIWDPAWPNGYAASTSTTCQWSSQSQQPPARQHEPRASNVSRTKCSRPATLDWELLGLITSVGGTLTQGAWTPAGVVSPAQLPVQQLCVGLALKKQ